MEVPQKRPIVRDDVSAPSWIYRSKWGNSLKIREFFKKLSARRLEEEKCHWSIFSQTGDLLFNFAPVAVSSFIWSLSFIFQKKKISKWNLLASRSITSRSLKSYSTRLFEIRIHWKLIELMRLFLYQRIALEKLHNFVFVCDTIRRSVRP